MTDYSSTGQIRPVNTEPIGRDAEFLRQHANSIQAGSNTLSLTTTDSGIWVTYPVAYPTGVEPLILVTVMPLGAAGVLADIRWGSGPGGTGGRGTATQFYFQGRRSSGTGTIRINWMICGRADG